MYHRCTIQSLVVHLCLTVHLCQIPTIALSAGPYSGIGAASPRTDCRCEGCSEGLNLDPYPNPAYMSSICEPQIVHVMKTSLLTLTLTLTEGAASGYRREQDRARKDGVSQGYRLGAMRGVGKATHNPNPSPNPSAKPKPKPNPNPKTSSVLVGV